MLIDRIDFHKGSKRSGQSITNFFENKAARSKAKKILADLPSELVKDALNPYVVKGINEKDGELSDMADRLKALISPEDASLGKVDTLDNITNKLTDYSLKGIGIDVNSFYSDKNAERIVNTLSKLRSEDFLQLLELLKVGGTNELTRLVFEASEVRPASELPGVIQDRKKMYDEALQEISDVVSKALPGGTANRIIRTLPELSPEDSVQLSELLKEGRVNKDKLSSLFNEDNVRGARELFDDIKALEETGDAPPNKTDDNSLEKIYGMVRSENPGEIADRIVNTLSELSPEDSVQLLELLKVGGTNELNRLIFDEEDVVRQASELPDVIKDRKKVCDKAHEEIVRVVKEYCTPNDVTSIKSTLLELSPEDSVQLSELLKDADIGKLIHLVFNQELGEVRNAHELSQMMHAYREPNVNTGKISRTKVSESMTKVIEDLIDDVDKEIAALQLVTSPEGSAANAAEEGLRELDNEDTRGSNENKKPAPENEGPRSP